MINKNIEYRVYNKIHNDYYFALSSLNFENGSQGIGSITVVTMTGEWIDIMNEGQLIIEQYTGFNDDEEHKIFEGDIVKAIYKTDYSSGKEYKEDEYEIETGIVVWNQEKGSYQIWGYGSLGYIMESAQQIKVIGHRHNKILYDSVYNEGLQYE